MKRIHLPLALFVFAAVLMVAVPAIATDQPPETRESPVACADPVSSCETSEGTQASWLVSALHDDTKIHLFDSSAISCLQSCDCCDTAADCPPLDGFTAVCDQSIACDHGAGSYGGCTYC